MKPTSPAFAFLISLIAVGCVVRPLPPTVDPLAIPGALQLTSDNYYYRDLIWAPDAHVLAATRCPVVSAEVRCLHQEEAVLLDPTTGDLEIIDLLANSPDTIAARPVAWSPGSDTLLLYVEERAAGDGASSSQYGYLRYQLSTRRFELLSVVGTVLTWDDTGERLLMVRPESAGGLALGWLSPDVGDFEVELEYTEQDSLSGPYALSPDGATLLRGDSVHAGLCDSVQRYQMGTHEAFEPYLTLACFPSWSPDGSRIMYAEKDVAQSVPSRLVVIDADGGNPRSLFGEDRISGLSFPAWSPDGTHVAFTRTGLGNASAIYVAEVPAEVVP